MKLVTRTIKAYQHYIGVPVDDNGTVRVQIIGTITTNSKNIGDRAIKKFVKENGYDYGFVVKVEESSKLYGVSVEKFMEIAEPITRTVKEDNN